MKRVILHAKRIIRKFWIFLLLVFAGSPFIGIPVFFLMLLISLLFFRDPFDIDEKVLSENFTKDEMLTEEQRAAKEEALEEAGFVIDSLKGYELQLPVVYDPESILDDDYLELYARMQNFICPQRVDRATVLTRVRLTNDAYIYEYDLNEQDCRVKENFEVKLKEEILYSIDKKDVRTMRMIRSKRKFIYRYWNTSSEGYRDIIVTPEELNN